jgi:two-component system, NtrC family, response regulator
MTKPALLLVEDDEGIRTQLRWALANDYDVVTADDRAAAIASFSSNRPAVTLLDLGLPPHPNDPQEGLAVLAALLTIDPAAKVIVVSGQDEREIALRAVGAGAFDFLFKPVAIDELKILVQRCVYVAGLEHEFRMMHQSGVPDMFEDILGTSAQMETVFNFVRKVGPTTAPVLILGESGTGKEMVARALHRRSLRKNGPFTAINCSAIPESLLESELFGHEKGAFTGAHSQRLGQVETAAGGTLFLDEIGELPAAIQVKLLRFLQEKRFQRVGGRHEIHSDTRVIAATNRHLQGAVARGEFRDDLYFRLAVVVVQIPPLRARGEDIAIVAREFLRRFAVEHGKPMLTFTPDAQRAIERHAWPGNVRELQNRVHRAVIAP